MLLSLNWLKDHLHKTDVRIDPKDLAEKLTMRGLQVAALKRPPSQLENVVVGRIEKINRHPNADRLQVTEVVISAEASAERLQIVCGAKNIAEGDIVPVALPGAVLPGNFAIKHSTIRGVESRGMLCSAKELGVSDEAEGILQLPKHANLGEPVSRLLGASESDDTILEFELTPNRGDCLSVIGIAREVAPLLKTKLRDPKPARFRVSSHRTSSIIKVDVDDAALCPRYVARVIDGIKVTESPEWIKQRLQAVGLRPINNIVDITNFVMMETGQPLHAFDLRRLQSGGVRVGACKQEMDFTLLTGQTVKLQPGDILILDGDRPVALAGIMGGQNSHVEDDTTSIVLESAAFPAEQIRRTAKRLGLHTDSSKRFEKGTDLAAVAAASERAAALLRDSFGANVYHPPIDTNEFGVKEPIIALDMRDIRRITGLKQLSPETVVDLLESIGISAHRKSVNVLSVRLPSFRPDLKESIDLIEEIARLHGYDTIPLHYPLSYAMYDRFDESQFEFEQKTRAILCGLGIRETIHYSFTSEENLSRFGLLNESMVRIKNPISEDMRVMRTSLLPSLLGTYSYNKNRHAENQAIFEVARVYLSEPREETKVREIPHVAGLVSGYSLPPSWSGKSHPVDFYHGKGIVEHLLGQLTGARSTYEQPKNSRLLHPNHSAVVKLGNREIGFVGELHPFLRRNELGTTEAVVVFELSLEALKRFECAPSRYKPPSKFPAVQLDIAVLVDRGLSCQTLVDTIEHTGGNLLWDVRIFDAYEGERVVQGKKSLAFRLTFVSPERTLQEEEALSLRDKIVQALTEKHGAQLRA